MRVEFSKEFVKALDKLSGKIHKSVVDAVNQVFDATTIDEIANCKKIESLRNVYRIRIGAQRAFFALHIHVEGDIVRFEYLFSRGEAYGKKNMEKLKNRDR
ncbi:MAG: hypothetical protein NC324_03985 [Bacteroides sp.]|nr:hypothetical protein [Bacteroides sp.]MCM1085879.1 hypothetical protein [Bacteroides sp.]MCM1169079.1 hypothetical protein [Bacteroides sp.]